eukprot:TRINITY_DN31708_c0_g1_i1.p1 TRINITY_DN31708_c0_g1~~TRINITY_DN31708_c0_g1_i1.p1  ORF type:complete len:158 (+),score=6.84 TRINITY_DN31708_c0_g1_i1:50-523(+)
MPHIFVIMPDAGKAKTPCPLGRSVETTEQLGLPSRTKGLLTLQVAAATCIIMYQWLPSPAVSDQYHWIASVGPPPPPAMAACTCRAYCRSCVTAKTFSRQPFAAASSPANDVASDLAPCEETWPNTSRSTFTSIASPCNFAAMFDMAPDPPQRLGFL